MDIMDIVNSVNYETHYAGFSSLLFRPPFFLEYSPRLPALKYLQSVVHVQCQADIKFRAHKF
jgi:hypothetical protein